MGAVNANLYYDPSLPATAPGVGWVGARGTRRGETRMIDFITHMIEEGRGYQVRAGTIATGLAAQNVIADTSADMCYDAASGYTVIPIQLGIAVRDVVNALTFQAALKAVSVVSTSGTAFIPLLLKLGGTVAASNIARVQADTVVVAAELATTTLRLFEYENNLTEAPTTFNAGLQQVSVQASAAQLQGQIVGPGTIYLQVASTTAQVLYFAHLNVLELLSTSIG